MIMNKAKIVTAILLTWVFNSFINLSDMYFYTALQASFADALIIIGVVGIISCQIVGAYTILTYLEKKDKI